MLHATHTVSPLSFFSFFVRAIPGHEDRFETNVGRDRKSRGGDPKKTAAVEFVPGKVDKTEELKK